MCSVCYVLFSASHRQVSRLSKVCEKYKIIFRLKHFIIQQMHKYIFRRCNSNYYKIFKIAPKYFGSQGIHHQGTFYSAWLKLQ